MLPSGPRFSLNTHFPRRRFAPSGSGVRIRIHVLFSSRESSSQSTPAFHIFQLGSFMASLKDFGSVGSGLGAANRAVTTPYDFGGWPLFGLEDILTGGCSEMCFGGSGVIIRSDCAGRFFYL